MKIQRKSEKKLPSKNHKSVTVRKNNFDIAEAWQKELEGKGIEISKAQLYQWGIIELVQRHAPHLIEDQDFKIIPLPGQGSPSINLYVNANEEASQMFNELIIRLLKIDLERLSDVLQLISNLT
jgi:hypothetical protein